MKKRSLTTPELMFLIGTRAALAAGVALLVSNGLKSSTRTTAGAALAALGVATTIPAARIFVNSKPLLSRLRALAS